MVTADLRRKLIHHTGIIMFVLSGIITLGLLWLLSMMGSVTDMDYMDEMIKKVLSVAFLLLLCLDGITFSLALILNMISASENEQHSKTASDVSEKKQNQSGLVNDDQRLII